MSFYPRRAGGGHWPGVASTVPCCMSAQDTLLECVSKRVPILLSRGMARLVVVDSIAAPFRCEFDSQASAVRAKHLQSLGATLRRLSSTFRSPVLCINQVGGIAGEGAVALELRESRTGWVEGSGYSGCCR